MLNIHCSFSDTLELLMPFGAGQTFVDYERILRTISAPYCPVPSLLSEDGSAGPV